MGLFDFFKKRIKFGNLDEMVAEIFSNAPEDEYVHTKRSRQEFEQGCTRLFTYTVRKYCEDCEGRSESFNGSQCEACENSSIINTPLGPMITACGRCQNKVYTITNLCKNCGGNGWTEIQESHEVDIPPEFNEPRITIPGKGHYVDSQTRGALVVMFKDAGKYGRTV